MQIGSSLDDATNTMTSLASLHVSQQEVAAALMEDEAVLKQAMAVAAERARKRRLEDEEKRQADIERAKKKKLADLEAKVQAEKEAKERALKEAEDQARREKEEAERLAKLEAESRAEKERALQSARMPPPPPRPPMPSDTVDSWRGSAPARPSITTQAPASGRRLTNGSSDLRRSPTVILKQRHFDHPQPSPAPKPGPVDLSGKPANSAVIAEVAALQSKTVDDSVQILHFSDLRQLAEGYGQTLSVSTVAVNESDLSAPTEPIVNLKSAAETQSTRPQESGSNLAVSHSPFGAGFDDSRGFKLARATKTGPPAALNFVPRGSQEHGQASAPASAGLSPSWSPRVQDPSQPGYRQAPISVLDDTLSRFKMAIMHSNPVHAGMSSDDIMQGLGRGGLDTDRGTQNPTGSITTGNSLFSCTPPSSRLLRILTPVTSRSRRAYLGTDTVDGTCGGGRSAQCLDTNPFSQARTCRSQKGAGNEVSAALEMGPFDLRSSRSYDEPQDTFGYGRLGSRPDRRNGAFENKGSRCSSAKCSLPGPGFTRSKASVEASPGRSQSELVIVSFATTERVSICP